MSTLIVENLKGPTTGSNANKITIPSGQELHAAGHVIDHKYMQYGVTTTLSSGSYTDSNLTLNVTPKSTSSKFIITYNVFFYMTLRVNGWSAAAGRILRDSTVIHTDGYSLGRGATYNYGTYVNPMFNTSDTYEDEPSTTSQITYKVQFASYQSHTIYLHQGNQKGFLSVTEIAQ